MPLDVEPVADGPIVLTPDGSLGRIAGLGDPLGVRRYNPHHRTCPDAQHWRPGAARRARDRAFAMVEAETGRPVQCGRRPCPVRVRDGATVRPCGNPMPEAWAVCEDHYQRVPPRVRHALFTHSRPGQAPGGPITPTSAWRSAARAAIEALEQAQGISTSQEPEQLGLLPAEGDRP